MRKLSKVNIEILKELVTNASSEANYIVGELEGYGELYGIEIQIQRLKIEILFDLLKKLEW